MSALGQKQTSVACPLMSALSHKQKWVGGPAGTLLLTFFEEIKQVDY